MTISKTQFPQKLHEGSCTKPDFKRGLNPENHIRINFFEISRCFHYFVQPLYLDSNIWSPESDVNIRPEKA